jgi:tetratricopeptide (TPR) repeat protein
MPSTVNGVGTHYYGKKNLYSYQGQCQSCRRITSLTCYDTRLFVVVVFIPIIPLGRKRIIDHCGACTRHYAMAYKEWEVASQRAQTTLDSYRAAPTDSQLAEEAMVARISLRDVQGFLSLAPEIEKNLPQDAKLLCKVASAYEFFNRLPDSERLLRKATEADPNEDDIREILADNLIRQDKPEEAEPYVQHVITKGVPDRIDSLYQLAQAYARKGNHDKALEYFEHCESVNPMITKDNTFNKLKAESAKRLGTKMVVNSGDLLQKERASATRWKTAKIAAVVAVLAVIAYAALSLYQGNARQIYVANGLDKPYAVRLNGKQHQLAPHDITPVRLPEGDITIEIVDPPFPMPPEKVSIKTSFLTRPFNGRVFVINPDRSALLTRQRVFYTARTTSFMGSGPPPQDNYLIGRTLHEVDGVDYPFTNPPDTVQMESKNNEVEKVVLKFASSANIVSPSMMLYSMIERVGQDTIVQVTQRRLLMEPSRTEYLNLLHVMMPHEQFAEFLRPGLEKRPILLQWHRAYQSALETPEREPKIKKEYEDLLAKEPQNKDLMYLSGRVAHNIDKTYALLNKAAAGNDPCPYALHSLGGYHLEIGDFAKAAQLCERAATMLPEEPDIRYYYKQSLLASGQYPKLMELVRKDENERFPNCLAAFSDEILLHHLTNKRGEVDGVLHRLRQRMHEFEKALVEREVAALQAVDQYCAGTTAFYATVLRDAKDPEDRFLPNLAIGAVGAAQSEAEKMKPSSEVHLLLFIAATGKGESAIASKNFDAAVKLLSEGDHEDRVFASALRNPSSVPINDLLRLRQYPAEKVLLLTALGIKHPTLRAPCFNLARKLNYDRRFPHLLVKSVLASAPNK